jgi:hypothetical protein
VSFFRTGGLKRFAKPTAGHVHGKRAQQEATRTALIEQRGGKLAVQLFEGGRLEPMVEGYYLIARHQAKLESGHRW